MSRHVRSLILPAALTALAGCAGLPGLQRAAPAPDPADPQVAVFAAEADSPRPEPRGGAPARTADAFDRTTEAERAAATAPAAGGAILGVTTASLGDPAEPGFWMTTGLVTSPRQGRVEAAGGASVRVELRPSGSDPGAGSTLSLPAFRALGLSLTALPRLTVYAD